MYCFSWGLVCETELPGQHARLLAWVHFTKGVETAFLTGMGYNMLPRLYSPS